MKLIAISLLSFPLLATGLPSARAAGTTCFLKPADCGFWGCVQVDFYEGTKLQGTISHSDVFISAKMNLGKSCSEIYALSREIYRECGGLCKLAPGTPAPKPEVRGPCGVTGWTAQQVHGQCAVCKSGSNSYDLFVQGELSTGDGGQGGVWDESYDQALEWFNYYVRNGRCD